MSPLTNVDMFYDKEPSRYDLLVEERKMAIDAYEDMAHLEELIEAQQEVIDNSLAYAAQIEEDQKQNIVVLKNIQTKGFMPPSWYTEEIFKEREKGA